MARGPHRSEPGSPGSVRSTPRTTPPPELMPATDNLYVTHSVGKLTEAVDRLTEKVASVDARVVDLRSMADKVAGGIRVALWVGLPLLTGFIGLALYLLNQKWETAIQVLQAISKPQG